MHHSSETWTTFIIIIIIIIMAPSYASLPLHIYLSVSLPVYLSVSLCLSGRGVELTTELNLVPRPRMM
jgi:hypothetical protein